MNRIRACRWMGTRCQDKLTGNSVSLDGVWMWRVIVISLCEEVGYSKLQEDMWKAREPNDRLWRETKSSWEEDICFLEAIGQVSSCNPHCVLGHRDSMVAACCPQSGTRHSSVLWCSSNSSSSNSRVFVWHD